MIFDIGPKSAQELADIIMKAGTVLWNGPGWRVRVRPVRRRHQDHRHGHRQHQRLHSGGWRRHIAAIQKYDIYDKVSYISTPGGAFLEYLEGKVLPAVAILEERAKG